MKKRLDTHVTTILMVFAGGVFSFLSPSQYHVPGAGSILAIVELFSVVLACCLAQSFSFQDTEEEGHSPGVPTQYNMR